MIEKKTRNKTDHSLTLLKHNDHAEVCHIKKGLPLSGVTFGKTAASKSMGPTGQQEGQAGQFANKNTLCMTTRIVTIVIDLFCPRLPQVSQN